MSAKVALSRIVAALDELAEGQSAHLELASGEIVHVLDPVIYGDDIADLEPSADDVDGPEYAALPTRFDVHEWTIMRDFCDRAEDEDLRDRLLRAVHGRGAFRRFKDVVYEEGIQDDWFAYREARLADIARAWLEVEGVPYVDDVVGTLE
jgi:hypothetical protein